MYLSYLSDWQPTQLGLVWVKMKEIHLQLAGCGQEKKKKNTDLLKKNQIKFDFCHFHFYFCISS